MAGPLLTVCWGEGFAFTQGFNNTIVIPHAHITYFVGLVLNYVVNDIIVYTFKPAMCLRPYFMACQPEPGHARTHLALGGVVSL